MQTKSCAKLLRDLSFAPAIMLACAVSAMADPQQLQITDLTDQDYHLHWDGVAGRTYFLRHSPDLDIWSYLPVIEFGPGPHNRLVQDSSDKFFLGLHHIDISGVSSRAEAMAADADGDGLSNMFELSVGLNPFALDSDGNGTLDGDEDADGDGIINSAELVPYFAWDAAADTDGDGQWESTTANSYNWIFDGGALSPVDVFGSRFAGLTKAYEFPTALDDLNGSWDAYGSDAPASFEFVLYAAADDGVIFEAGGNTDGLRVDLLAGVLHATISEDTDVVATHTLTAEQKAGFIHVVVVVDSAGDVLELYVDGELVDFQPWTAGDIWSSSNSASIGGTSSGTSDGQDSGNFVGKIAQFKFYQTALSADEIALSYDLLDPITNHAPIWKNNPLIGAFAEEGVSYSASLSGEAVDVDGDMLTYSKVAGPAWLEVAQDGSLSGIPSSIDLGLNTFTASVTDNLNPAVEATLEISVNAAQSNNAAPIASNQDLQTSLDIALGVTLSATDPEGDELTYSVVNQPTSGTLTGAAPNLTYTPTAGFIGVDEFTFKANDTQADSNTATVRIYVGAPNAHFAWDAAADIDGDGKWESTTTNTYDWGFDSGALSPEAVTGSRITTLTKAYRLPAAADVSNNSWNGYGSSDSASFEFVLDADADDGVIFESGGSGDGFRLDLFGGALRASVSESTVVYASHLLTAQEKSDFIHVVVVADNLNDVLELYIDGALVDSQDWSTGADWSGGDNAGFGGTNSSTPDDQDSGDFTGRIAQFKFYQSALSLEQVAANFSWVSGMQVNLAPVFTTNPITKADASTDLSYSATLAGTATDNESDPLTFAKVAGPTWLNVTDGGVLTGTPTSADAGLNTFRISVTDSINPTVEATLKINVFIPGTNYAPVADSQNLQSPLDTAIGVTLTAADDNGDELTYSIVDQPTNGTLTGTAPNLTYTPNVGYFGIEQFSFKANDTQVDSNTAIVRIYVGAPSAYFAWDATADTDGDSQWESTTANAYDWNFDGGILSPEDVTSPRFTSLTKAYVFPAAIDIQSNHWNGYGSSASASFEFVLDADADDGVIFETGGSGDGFRVDLLAGVLRACIAESTDVVATHTLTAEQKADFIHVVVVADNVGDVLQLYVDGELMDFQPWATGDDWSGKNNAGFGGTNSSTPDDLDSGDFVGKIAQFNFYQGVLSAEQVGANFAWVENQSQEGSSNNQPPVFVADSILGADATEDEVYASTLNDPSIVSDPDKDTLIFAKVAGPAWLTVAANGSLGGSPENDDVGANVFFVSVSDGEFTDSAAFNITVSNTNDELYAAGDELVGFDATQDQPYNYQLPQKDEDGDILTYTKIEGPNWISVSADGLLSGIPTNDDVGWSVLRIDADDGVGDTVWFRISVPVNNVNDAPVFNQDPIDGGTVDEDSPYSFNLSAFVDDVDESDTLTYFHEFRTGDEWMSVNPETGEITGTPTQMFVGNNQEIIGVTDGKVTVYAEINITVIDTIDPPYFFGPGQPQYALPPAMEDEVYTKLISATDPDGDELTYAKVDGPDWLSVAVDGTVSGMPTNEDVGDTSFTISASDSVFDPVEQVFNMEVINTNDAPTFIVEPISVPDAPADAPYEMGKITLANNAQDDDGDALTYTKTAGPVWLTIADNGGLSGTPTQTDIGENIFSIGVSDGNGGSDTASLTIHVVDDPLSLTYAKAIYKFEDYQDVDPGGGQPIYRITPDLSGNGNDAVVLDAAEDVSGPGVSKAIQLDGIDDGLVIANTSNHEVIPATGQPFSLSFWFNIEGFDTDKWSNLFLSEEYLNKGFRCYIDGTNPGNETLKFSTGQSGGTAVLGNVPVSLNTWYHVAVVYDGANTAKLYFDGNLAVTDDTSDVYGSESTVHMGRAVNGLHALKGRLDDVYFYGTQLSAEQIDQLRFATLATPTDLDGDGMSDEWEITHGLDPSNPNDALLDADSDGADNLKEFGASTNPARMDNPLAELLIIVE